MKRHLIDVQAEVMARFMDKGILTMGQKVTVESAQDSFTVLFGGRDVVSFDLADVISLDDMELIKPGEIVTLPDLRLE